MTTHRDYTTGDTLTNGVRYRFGAGSLELIEASVSYKHGHKHLKVSGWFDIYCGQGDTHRVRINPRRECVGGCGEFDYRADTFDLEAAVAQIIDYDLEYWFDPCEREES